MTDDLVENALLLPDLSINNFRGIKRLSIPSLGRVTLLAGRNGVGKTTVLEAIQVYATRARYAVLRALLTSREEFSVATDEDGDSRLEPDWGALFYGRYTTENNGLFIGPSHSRDQLKIDTVGLSELSDEDRDSLGRLFPESFLEGGMYTLKTTFQGDSWTVPVFFFRDQRVSTVVGGEKQRGLNLSYRIRWDESRLPSPTTCEEIGPGLINNLVLSQFWDKVALTEDESQATQALNLVYGGEAERVAVVGDESPRSMRGGRRAIVRLKGNARPVPLKSLGDGALRLFGIALALANSRDGFLLIDEAENGIHHSVQQDYWRMVLQTAHKNNVQVFATTHSFDCVRGFARAAVENEYVEGVLVRLEEEHDVLHAVRYSEDEVRTAAEHNTEVR